MSTAKTIETIRRAVADYMREICKHPFVWPNGDCVQCRVLATAMPGHTEPIHIMVPRRFAPLLEAYAPREQAIKELVEAAEEQTCSIRECGHADCDRLRSAIRKLKGEQS